MSVSTRLQNVTQSLSPQQRALLVLKAMHEGRDFDPSIREINDPQQRRVFNRYMALLWVANHRLAAIAASIAFRVEVAEKEKYLWQILNEAADLLDEAEGSPPSKGQRNWRGKGDIQVSVFLRSLALECRDDTAALVTHLWQEVTALERVWRDLSGEFAGEDAVIPEHRQRIDETIQTLRDVAKTLQIRKLPDEPEEAIVSMLTEAVNDSFRHLGFAEPY